MKFVLNDYKQSLSDEEILQDIKKVAKKFDTDYISISIYKKNGKFSQTAIQNHFGSWKNALSYAGLRTERNKKELSVIKDEDYIRDFLRVARLIDKSTVTYEDYERHGKYSNTYVFKRFGLWDNVLVQAGLQPTGIAHHKISEQDLFEEIERIWMTLGKQPTTTDIIKRGISKYSIDTYKRRFGGWRKTLEAFMVWINANKEGFEQIENKMEQPKTKEVINFTETSKDSLVEKSHKTSRNINLRLRFKVMQRDNFTCVCCGESPAKNKDIILHVDHIIPWSQGGETLIDNLQTLCSKCNLGKGNIKL